MSRPAIIVDGLGKAYSLGLKAKRFPTFREAMTDAVTSAVRRLRHPGDGGTHGRNFWALKDVSFEVHPGEVVGIIGRNGAGKSTLLKILSRITEPTTGSARVRGRLAALLEVGTGFHPDLTGRENIYINGSILGMKKSEIDRRFDAIVAFAEVEQFLDTQVKHYSSGMAVRLAFAVAAHLEPQILVIDEVLAVGDTAFQKKCLGRIEEVMKQGRTVLFVSHNVPTVQNLCTRCILMERGTLKMDGLPADVLDAYNRATAGRMTSEEDLTRHPGRAPESRPCMTRVRVSAAGDNDSHVCMGDDLIVDVDFAMTEPINQISLWVFVKNNMNIPIFGVDTDMNPPAPLAGPTGRGRVSCRIDRLPLMPGTYSLDLFFGSRNLNLDWIYDACRFEVHPADVFGSGKLPHPLSGNVFWPATWEITTREPADAFAPSGIAP